jgi:hypothetical protein
VPTTTTTSTTTSTTLPPAPICAIHADCPNDPLSCTLDYRCSSEQCVPTNELKDCDDGNPCTTDTCVNGVCQNVPHNLCNDSLVCTTDTCVPDGPDAYHCENKVDLRNCGPLTACQTAQCGVGRDCLITNNDDLCPTHPTASACLSPVCDPSDGRCKYQDICVASYPDCNGCATCTCNSVLNKCVKSCPS